MSAIPAPSRGDTTRARILHAAVQLLSRRGPDGFTASALATEAGVSKATVFHHFTTLDDVPLAAFEEILLAGMTRVEDGGSSLEEYLHALSGEMHPIIENEQFVAAYLALVVKAMGHPPLMHRIRESGEEMHRAMTKALAPRLGSEVDAGVAANLVEVVLDGLSLHQMVAQDTDRLERTWRYFVSLLTREQPR
jgi:AcrR family transcriptional regulator